MKLPQRYDEAGRGMIPIPIPTAMDERESRRFAGWRSSVQVNQESSYVYVCNSTPYIHTHTRTHTHAPPSAAITNAVLLTSKCSPQPLSSLRGRPESQSREVVEQ